MAKTKKETTTTEKKKVVETPVENTTEEPVVEETPVVESIEDPVETITEEPVVEDVSDVVFENTHADDISKTNDLCPIDVDEYAGEEPVVAPTFINECVGAYVAHKLTEDNDGAPVSTSHFHEDGERQGVVACNLSNI
jgi:hypothetical protein